MNSTKYIGMDVHKETIAIAVMNAAGKLVMESIVETKATTFCSLSQGLRGELHVTFEEGTWAAWLYDLLKPHVTKVVVCNPRKNALLKTGNKSDRIDARKLAELLRAGLLSAVYHGETGLRTLKELCRSYLAISKDLTRAMNRIKALYRSWAIPCAGTSVYAPRHRAEWLNKITEAGVRRRAELFYQQLDGLQALRQEARRDLLAESRKHGATKLLRQIPYIGPIRAALLIALIQTPHRFRTKRQLWAYSGLALETHSSGEYHYVQGQLQRSKRPVALRGLNQNHNHDLKSIFKGAATKAGSAQGPFHDFYYRVARQRDEAYDGSPHVGTQDRDHHFAGLEERSAFRRPTAKTASALERLGKESVSAAGIMPGDDPSDFLRRSGSRESIQRRKLGSACLRHLVSGPTLCPLGQPEKAIGHESLIGPWLATLQPSRLSVSGTEGRRLDRKMEPQEGQNFAASRDEAKDDRKSERVRVQLGAGCRDQQTSGTEPKESYCS